MPEIRVGRKSSIADMEALLEDLTQSPPDTDLLLPTALFGRQLGGTSALLQFVISWRRTCAEGRLRTHVQEGDVSTSRVSTSRVDRLRGCMAPSP